MLRWCLRSRWRTVSLLASSWMVGDLLRRAGFFTWCRDLYERFLTMYAAARATAEEAGAWGIWVFELAESLYEFASRFGDPWALLVYAAGGILIIWGFSGAPGGEDPTPTRQWQCQAFAGRLFQRRDVVVLRGPHRVPRQAA